MGCKCHGIAKSPGSQTNNKSSKHDMTPEFCKNIKRPISTPSDLGSQGTTKYKKKSQIGWRQMLVPSLPPRNNFLVIVVKNYTWQM